MRRASTSPSIQLFPFLAVLVCAMGALILLLLVTTRKMRQAAVARAEFEAEEAAEAARLAIRPVPKPVPVPSGPTPEQLAAKTAERTSRREANAAARKRQSTREKEWQRSLAEKQIALDQRRERVSETQRELESLQERLQATETNLQHLIDRKSQLKSDLDNDTKLRAKLEREQTDLSDSIIAVQKKLADLRRAHADSASKFAFIPYDGASGTTRRPIYIECTSTGIRFQPENTLLDESDLKGFTETYNPLLVASQRLMQYWREQAIAGDPRQLTRPYVLLLVRPKGTISYYVARKMLSNLGDDFGYELIEEDFQLQLPTADPVAKVVLQSAIADSLKHRGEILAEGGRVGEARLGDVLIGRSEDTIEFGTLDDQVAANTHREENPFKKNSGGQGKSFAITRSPVNKDELARGSFKSALAERERRRAQGVPDSLADMSGRGNPYGPPGTGSPSTGTPGTESSGAGTPGTGSPGAGSPGAGSPATASRGTGPIQPFRSTVADGSNSGANGPRPDDARTYVLGDPFSREHLARGRSGPGTADGSQSQGERVAGDAAGAPNQTEGGAGTPGFAGQTGSRTASRGGGSGLPNGARAAKVMEISNGVTPIGDGTESAGTGAGTGTSTKITSRGGVPGGKLAAGGEIPSGFAQDGGGDPYSAGTSDDPNAPRGRGGDPNGGGGQSGAPQERGAARGSGMASGQGRARADAPDTAFRKPQSEAESTQGGTPGAAGDGTPGTAGSRGPGGGMKARSTNPNLQQPRQYGDNPEARRDMAAKSSSSSSSVMQKRDEARRRWGGSNTGQIGFERKVLVEITSDRVFIERNDIEVIIEPGTSKDELVEAMLLALDEHSLGWGKPPTKFYWIPYLKFEVYGAGASEYERMNAPLREWGIFSEVEFKAGDRPTQVPDKTGLIQPVSEAKDAPKTSVKSTKPTRPTEDPGKKPAKKTPFNLFKKLGTK